MFCWVEPDLFSLECNEVSSSEFGGVYGFGMALGSLFLMFRAVFLFCWRINMVYLALDFVGSWEESLVSGYMWRLLGELLCINIPWSQEFSVVLKFWS